MASNEEAKVVRRQADADVAWELAKPSALMVDEMVGGGNLMVDVMVGGGRSRHSIEGD